MDNQEQPVLGGQPADSTPSILDTQPIAEQPASVEPTAPAAPITPVKKKSKTPLIIAIVLILLAAGVAVFFLFFFNKTKCDELSFEKKTPAPEAFTAATKLLNDYEAGALTPDEYAKQLIYSEYDASKLDEKYKSDAGALVMSNVRTLIKLLKEKKSEISTATKQEAAKHLFLTDVAFGSNKTAKAGSVVLAAEQPSYLHRLDKVVMSENGNFLIWYTESGEDKITTAQANQLAKNLETNIAKYSELTGRSYAFESIMANEGNGGLNLMKERLAEESNIPKEKIKTAMSVYVLDTKSEHTLASYNYLSCADTVSSCDAIFALADVLNPENLDSSAVAWPYVVVNTKSFAGSKDEADQVINHELFHHYQNKIICATDSVRYNSCPNTLENDKYIEALANFFSAQVSGGADKDNVLNGWAGVFAANTNSGVKYIQSSGVSGYGQWPYFYSYKNNATEGLSRLVEAHRKSDPYSYLDTTTSSADLRKAINDAAYRAISKDYDIDPLKNEEPVVFENETDENFDLKFVIMPGGIQYYNLGQNWSVEFSSSDEHVSAVLLGKKSGKYSVLETKHSSLSTSNGAYSGYSDFVIAITNAKHSSTADYKLKYKQNDAPDAVAVNHKYDNYSVEYTMEIVFAGIKTSATGKGRVDEKHQRSYLETEFSTLMGISMDMTTYSDYYNGVDYYTNPQNSLGGGLGDLLDLFKDEDTPSWIKSNNASHTIDIDLVVKKLRDAKQTRKVSDGHYKTKMSTKEMQDLMNTAKQADDKNKKGENALEIKDGTVEIDVYVNEYGRVTKLDYDFSGMVEGIDKFTCTMKPSDYNTAGDVIIPESVRYGAKEQ